MTTQTGDIDNTQPESGSTTLLFRDDYNDKFSSIGYLQNYWKVDEKWAQFHLDSGFRFMRHEAISGSRLLDLGCGPNLMSMIAAPDQFTHIVMADYSENNLDFIRQWSCGDDVAFDWDHACKYYSQKHNLQLTPSWGQTRLITLKSYIKDVTHCDVLQPEPLGPTYTGFFDCVFSSFCLEVAAEDVDHFNRIVQNVSSLLRNGGHLVVRSALGESCYPVDGKNFFMLPITVPQLTTALKDAGLNIINFTIEDAEDPYKVEVKGPTGYCILAQKVRK